MEINETDPLNVSVLKTFSQFEQKIPQKYKVKGEENYDEFRIVVGEQLLDYRRKGNLPPVPNHYKKGDNRDERWRIWLRQIDFDGYSKLIEVFGDQITYDLERCKSDGRFALLGYYRLHADLDNPKFAQAIDRKIFKGKTLSEQGFHLFAKADNAQPSNGIKQSTSDPPASIETVPHYAPKVEDKPESGQHKFRNISIGASISLALVLFLAVAVVFFSKNLEPEKSEREARSAQDEINLAAAWENLLRRSAGTSGKGIALNTVLKYEDTLQGQDFSCTLLGGEIDGICQNPPVFNNVQFGEKSYFDYSCNFLVTSDPQCKKTHRVLFSHSKLVEDINFSGVIAKNWDVDRVTFNVVDFSNMIAENWFVRNAEFVSMNWENFQCNFCAFENTRISLEAFKGLAYETWVSGLIVKVGTEPIGFSGTYNAHIENPPIFLKESRFIRNDEKDYLKHINWSYYKTVEFCVPEKNKKVADLLRTLKNEKPEYNRITLVDPRIHDWKELTPIDDRSYFCYVPFDLVKHEIKSALNHKMQSMADLF